MGYITLTGGSPYINYGYTIRGMQPDSITSSVNALDLEYHGTAYMGALVEGQTTSVVETFRESWTGTGGYTQDTLDPLEQSQIDLFSQNTLVGGGFSTDDVDGTFNAGLLIPNIGTAGISTESRYTENWLQPPFNQVGTYYVQFATWNLPSTAVIDIANCSVSFTSSESFATANTVTLPFNSTALVTPFPGTGGNWLWQVNRDVIANGGVDLSDVRAVRISLKAQAGTSFTFRAENMKMIPSSYTAYNVGVNNKIGRLKQERWPGTSQVDMPAIVQDNFVAKDFTHITKFLSGNLPGTANPNELSIYFRVAEDRVASPNSYVRVKIQSDSTKTSVFAYDGTALMYTENAGALTQQKDHYIISELDGNNVRVQIWEGESNRLKNLKLDTNYRPTTVGGTGLIGFDFKPYYGNFQLDYMYVRDLILAEYESVDFESTMPVRGVTLYPLSSESINLLISDFSESFPPDNLLKFVNEAGQNNSLSGSVIPKVNDVYAVYDTSVSAGSGRSLKVTKHLVNAELATVEYPDVLRLNDLSFASISGSLRYEAALNFGEFRIVLWDKHKQRVAFIGTIKDIAPNRWIDFDIPIITDVYTNEFKVEFQHKGKIAGSSTDPSLVGTFWLDYFQIKQKGIVWEASNNGGLTYVQFYDNLNDKYKSINFPLDTYAQLVQNEDVRIYWKLND